MTNQKSTLKIERLIDANLNRLKEGIRVVEDIARYIKDDASLALQLKTLRHKLQQAYTITRIIHRDIENDPLKESIQSELIRTKLDDIVIANFSRSQESSRVLEESFKLYDSSLSELFKSIRYELYALEKYYFTRYLEE